MPRKPRTPNTDALRRLIRRLHPTIDADAIVDSYMHGEASFRTMPEMNVNRLADQLPLRTAELIHLIPGIARATLRDRYPAHPPITCLDDACRFLYGHFLGLQHEYCYLLLMRKSRYLIRDLLIQTGTLDSVPFYARNIAEAVLAHDADALIVAHNHPGGTMAPSQGDLECTDMLIRALEPLGVPLLDHIIIAGSSGVSIRQTGHIPESVWLSQPCNCPTYLKSWLQPPKKKHKK